jgi:hypothetical protein
MQVNYDDERMEPSQVAYSIQCDVIGFWLEDKAARDILTNLATERYGSCLYEKDDHGYWRWNCPTFLFEIGISPYTALYELLIHFTPTGTKEKVNELLSLLCAAKDLYICTYSTQFDTLYRVGLDSANQDIARELVKYI